MVTKDWNSKMGLSRVPNSAQESILLVKGDISIEKIATFEKSLHVAIVSNNNLSAQA